MATPALTAVPRNKLWYFTGGTRIDSCNPALTNPNPSLFGNTTDISGDASNIFGNVSNLSGVVSGLRGRVSNLSGDATGITGECGLVRGDLNGCGLTPDDRIAGIDLSTLVLP